MGLNTAFTVLHKETEAQEQLGLGTVVGDLIRSTKVQYQDKIVKNGVQIPAMVTEEKSELMYQVLWENARDVSPSLHKSTDLVWVDVLGVIEEEEDDDGDGDNDELTDDTNTFVDDTGSIGFSSDMTHEASDFTVTDDETNTATN